MDDERERALMGTAVGDALGRAVALVVAIVAGGVGMVCALVAAGFAVRAFVSGWIPGRWFSDRLEDWVVGTGVQGDAGNYIGFITAAVPASICFSVAQWGFARATTSSIGRASSNDEGPSSSTGV